MGEINIKMEQQGNYTSGSSQGFRIKVTASSANPAPFSDAKIFLYHRSVPEPESGVAYDRFIAVCSPLDMEHYPADAPDPDISPPFFRLAEVDLVHTSKHVLLDCWDQIKKDVMDLSRTMTEMSTLELGEEFAVDWT